jgi:hypothetical protein
VGTVDRDEIFKLFHKLSVDIHESGNKVSKRGKDFTAVHVSLVGNVC